MLNLQIQPAELLVWLRESAWVAQVFFVVFFAFLCDFFVRRVLKKLQQKLGETPNPWDDAVLTALQWPVSLFIWVLGLSFVIDVIQTEMHTEAFTSLPSVRRVGAVIAITWFLLGMTRHLLPAIKSMDETTQTAVSKLLHASILISATLVMMQTFGLNIAGVLAFGGIGGIVIGFAARDLLANLFGGLTLYLDRPVREGDWISTPDYAIEGRVEKIGWRLTRIRTFNKRQIFVPNSIFSTMAIVNYAHKQKRPIHETLGVRHEYAGKITSIIAAVKKMLEEHPDVDTDSSEKSAAVNVDRFTPFSLNFFIHVYTKIEAWKCYHEVKQDVLMKVHEIIIAHGAKIAKADAHWNDE